MRATQREPRRNFGLGGEDIRFGSGLKRDLTASEVGRELGRGSRPQGAICRSPPREIARLGSRRLAFDPVLQAGDLPPNVGQRRRFFLLRGGGGGGFAARASSSLGFGGGGITFFTTHC